MYEDFYAFIPGSLEARQRLRKLRLKRLLYSFGAIVIFGSGFLLGLEWHDPNAAQPKLASTGEHQFEADLTPPVSTVLPQAQPVIPSWEPLPTPPSKPVRQAALDVDAKETITETDAAQLSSLILDAAATPLPPHGPDQAETVIQAKAVMQTEAASQPERPKPNVLKPEVLKVKNHEPQPTVADVNVSTVLKASRPNRVQTAPQPKPSRPYLVQVGAFKQEANARGVVAKLREKGYKPFIRAVPGSRNRVLHRVFIERVNDRAQAQAVAKAFEAAEKMDALVMLADNITDDDMPTSR